MGFRSGSFAKVWQVDPVKSTVTKGRISISKKNKQTGQYEQDFGGYVAFLGTTAAEKAAKLKEGDRIKLVDVDVTNNYNKETKQTYTNFNIYSFELDNEDHGSSNVHQEVDNVEVDDGEVDDSRLPF